MADCTPILERTDKLKIITLDTVLKLINQPIIYFPSQTVNNSHLAGHMDCVNNNIFSNESDRNKTICSQSGLIHNRLSGLFVSRGDVNENINKISLLHA